jgi:hypothetical protein
MGLRCGCENSDDDFMIMKRESCVPEGRISKVLFLWKVDW